MKSTQTSTGRDASIGSGGDGTGRSGPEIRAADTFEGETVVNRRGEDLGTIEDIMLDVQGARVAYAVMSWSGILGSGARLLAIPWSALTLDAERRCLVLDADRDRLEKAPGFDKDHWPAMADARWATQVHAFYGVHPYWNEGPPLP